MLEGLTNLIDPITGLKIASRAGSKYAAFRKEQKALEDNRAYLQERYGLPELEQRVVRRGALGGQITTHSLGHSWTDALVDVLRRILDSERVTKQTRCDCSDAVRLFSVMDGIGAKDHSGTFIFIWNFEGLQDNEILRALAELGQGRGNDLTLNLVQAHLRQWLLEDEEMGLRTRVLMSGPTLT